MFDITVLDQEATSMNTGPMVEGDKLDSGDKRKHPSTLLGQPHPQIPPNTSLVSENYL